MTLVSLTFMRCHLTRALVNDRISDAKAKDRTNKAAPKAYATVNAMATELRSVKKIF